MSKVILVFAGEFAGALATVVLGAAKKLAPSVKTAMKIHSCALKVCRTHYRELRIVCPYKPYILQKGIDFF